LPRWADEGAATLVEHQSERHRQLEILSQVTRDRQRIPLSRLLEIDEYPKDMQQVLALYAEGYSLADFLVQQHGEKGRAVYLQFLGDALATNWESAFRKHYGFQSLGDLEQKWGSWIMAGSPPLRRPEDGQLAMTTGESETVESAKATSKPARRGQDVEQVAIRGQSESSPSSLLGNRKPRTLTGNPVAEASTPAAAVSSPPPLPPTRRAQITGHSRAAARPL
jgi:hypothetical protein